MYVRSTTVRRARPTRTVALSLALCVAAPTGVAAAPARSAVELPVVDARANPALTDSLFGRSGKLRARFLNVTRPLGLSFLQRLLGDTVVHEPGRVYEANATELARPFSLITLLPFTEKVNGRLGSYRMGFWPSERRRAAVRANNPDGFIRVTPENQDTQVSEHFRLRDFITHDQQDVWPKYLVLREDLVDKLELVISDLEAHGTPVTRMVVMSGFRTPQYNARGVGGGGRARDSRHQYGDAADVFVDNDGNGRMDDLNRDGRIDARDAQVLIDATERVERRHPDLVGGAGRYRANAAHGPFAHIDVRGYRARWRNA